MNEFKSASDLASNFIRLYYPIAIYNPSELEKLYDQTAFIWRPGIAENEGVLAKLNKDKLPLPFNSDDDISIASYSANPFYIFINLSVTGTVTSPTQITAFIQNFVLQYNNGKIYIISDTINIFDPNAILSKTAKNIDVGAIQTNSMPVSMEIPQCFSPQFAQQAQQQEQPVQTKPKQQRPPRFNPKRKQEPNEQ